MHHVVYIHNNQGNEKLYVNGLEMYSGLRTGDFSSWSENNRLVLANETSGDRPWEGTYYLVAVYDEALDHDAVEQNYQAGFGNIQFTSHLDGLEPNVPYYLIPFARTDQGMAYGNVEELIIENVIKPPASGGYSIHGSISKSINRKFQLAY